MARVHHDQTECEIGGESCKYTGQMFDGSADGKGVLAGDKMLQEGYFKDGHGHGRGRLIRDYGDKLERYEGEFMEDNLYNGTFISIDSDGK